MNKMAKKISFLILTIVGLTGCFPTSFTPTTSYQLTSANEKKLVTSPINKTLLVSLPTATTVYQSNDMLYVKKDFQPSRFSRNNWDSPPSEMLLPIIVESLQNSGYFYAVVPAPTFAQTDWRLDTQLFKLQQNFIQQPSVVEMSVDVTLTDNALFKVIATHRFSATVPAPTDTPYGGVLAANIACQQIMEQISLWVVKEGQQYLKKQ